MKNHAADSKIEFPEKSILEPIGLTSPTRQPRSKFLCQNEKTGKTSQTHGC